jgi:hypothetical protein
MGTKASEKTRTIRKNRQLRKCRRALKNAKKRGASEYVVKRISVHMKYVENGEKPQATVDRVKFRNQTRKGRVKTKPKPTELKEMKEAAEAV